MEMIGKRSTQKLRRTIETEICIQSKKDILQKMSRNNSKEDKSLKSKSFLRPTFSSNKNYRSNAGVDAYSTYVKSKASKSKKKVTKTANKIKHHYNPARKDKQKGIKNEKMAGNLSSMRNMRIEDEGVGYKSNYLYKKNLANMLKMKNKAKKKGVTRNIHRTSHINHCLYEMPRCGSISYSSSISSVKDLLSKQKMKSNRKVMNSSVESNKNIKRKKKPNYFKDRKSLGENK
jgi:hypothetical protein